MASADASAKGFLARNISYSLSGQAILNGIDFHIVPGETHAFVGKQNEGKSTLGKILAGELSPDSGCIRTAGREYAALNPTLARSIGIEYIGEETTAFPNLSIADNLLSGSVKWWEGLGFWEKPFDRINEWLHARNIYLPYDQPLRNLRQDDWLYFVLLNRLYRHPKLLILDETFERLRPERYREIMRLIQTETANGMSVLWITHKLEDALENSDRVTVLRQGRILSSDPTGNLDRLSLLRLCYAELGAQYGEDIRREQFYELMNFMEAVLRDMPTAVIVCDLDNHVRFVNNRGKTMFPTVAAPNGIAIGELFGEGNTRLLDLVETSATTGNDGEWHSLSAKIGAGKRLVDVRTKVLQEKNVKIGCMVVIEDVTSREELRRSLTLSENLASVGLLAAGVAHEVNDPLAIISNYLGFIRNKSTDSQLISAANLAQEETVRIHQIVDNLVAFSGNTQPTSSSVDIGQLGKDLCRLLRFHNQGRSTRFQCNAPDIPLIINADPNEIRQVLLNLFRNSLDAMDKNGVISFTASEDWRDGMKVVKVILSDNGCGILHDNPNDIFKPFVTTKKNKGKHQGLGLSIVYGIMEKCDGSIHVRNLPEGGCEFVLYFPSAESPKTISSSSE